MITEISKIDYVLIPDKTLKKVRLTNSELFMYINEQLLCRNGFEEVHFVNSGAMGEQRTIEFCFFVC